VGEIAYWKALAEARKEELDAAMSATASMTSGGASTEAEEASGCVDSRTEEKDRSNPTELAVEDSATVRNADDAQTSLHPSPRRLVEAYEEPMGEQVVDENPTHSNAATLSVSSTADDCEVRAQAGTATSADQTTTEQGETRQPTARERLRIAAAEAAREAAMANCKSRRQRSTDEAAQMNRRSRPTSESTDMATHPPACSTASAFDCELSVGSACSVSSRRSEPWASPSRFTNQLSVGSTYSTATRRSEPPRRSDAVPPRPPENIATTAASTDNISSRDTGNAPAVARLSCARMSDAGSGAGTSAITIPAAPRQSAASRKMLGAPSRRASTAGGMTNRRVSTAMTDGPVNDVPAESAPCTPCKNAGKAPHRNSLLANRLLMTATPPRNMSRLSLARVD